jgi:regulator of protease activity HflC (stomatin/prohibitin superfamily)
VADGPESGNNDDAQDLDEPSPLGAAAPLSIGRQRRERSGDRRGGRRPGPRRIVAVLLALVLLALVPTFLSGLKKTPRDRIGISYGAGPFESAHFQRVVQPGSGLFFNGFFDPLYLYPSDQVNYIISKDKNVGASQNPDSVVAPTQDRVQVEYQVAVYFKLNTDLLRTFHEQLGLRYQAYTTNGWNNLIQDTFRQQIENALQEETRRISVADLFGNADVLSALQNHIQTTLSRRLEDSLGQRFFCAPTFKPGGTCGDPSFSIKKVDIPASVAKAFEDNRTSGIQVLTKTNEIAQREAEAKAIAALGLSGQDYTTLKAIESGGITFWVLPNSAGITLTPPNSGGATGTTTTTTPGGG